MRPGRTGRIAFIAGFVVLLVDGAAAVWLGQLTDHAALVVVGVLLFAGALALAEWYRRWRRALADIEAARRDLHAQIGALRRAVEETRGGRWHAR